MKKFLFILVVTVYSADMYAAINIIGGPTVRIPGITAATVVQLSGYNPSYPVRWLLNGAQVGGGATLNVTQAGTYFAQVNISTNPNNPFWTAAGSISIAGLAHNVTINGPNPLNQTTATQLCLTSNASSYVSSRTWIRNGVTDLTQACKTVDHPGGYAVTVTYLYGSQSSILTTTPVTINASLQAPTIQLSKTSYNPVIPPLLTITNASAFTAFWILCDDQIILYQTTPSIELPKPGRYSVGGLLSNKTIYTNDFIISKGNIPVPSIFSDGGYVITYEDPEIQLSTQPGYNNGYTWYFNGQAISGAASANVTIFNPGAYTVKGCASFPDGTTECQTSPPTQITGEVSFVNFVRKKVPLVASIGTLPQLDALPYTQINISSAYVDGFARPLQDVARAFSPSGKDVTGFSKYDAEGREPKTFLPIARQTNDGAYYHIPNSLQPLLEFYQKSNDKIANTAYPFAEALHELSPLNRLLKQGAPGEEFQLNTTHVKSFSYTTHAALDKVWNWAGGPQGLTASTYYSPGTLAITETTDENGNKEREFKNKQSHTILTEKVIEGGATLRTYFIYDDFGRLSYVIPPKTIAALPNTTTVSIAQDVIARECFSYTYDERGRVTAKNIPGGGMTYLVYDPWDRVTLTQQANQRAKNKWSFNKYDAVNRLIMTGEIFLSLDHAAARQAVVNFYANASSNLTLRYEDLNGTIHGYTNRSYPVLSNEIQVYSITYYDNYNFLPPGSTDYQFMPEPSLGLTENYQYVRKMVTGSKVVILGTNTYLNSVNYYDKYLRPIQLIAQNHLGGIDKMSNAYDFGGRLLKERIRHQGVQAVIVDKEITYDHGGRMLKVFHTINNGSKILLADNHYNELGELIEKNIHSDDGDTFLQSLDYAYNIRGWLSQVNPQEAESNVLYNDLYGFNLSYTTLGQTGIPNFQPSFNGNVTAFIETRPTRSDDTGLPFKSTFTYHYDARDQLRQATYYQPSNPTKNGTYDLPLITYDANGNILSLKRKGITNGAPGLIDNLNYSYQGNQLIGVDDSGDQGKGFIDK